MNDPWTDVALRVGITLVALIVCFTQATEVKVHYKAPELSFSAPGLRVPEANTRGVFHFVINGIYYRGLAIRRRSGLYYHTHEISVKGNQTVYVYLCFNHGNGHRGYRTRWYAHKLEEARPEVRGPPRRVGGPVIFRDDFNGFNKEIWSPEVSMYGGMNGEFQVYTNDQKNVFVKNGKLFLKPTLTIDDPRFDEKLLETGTMDMLELFGTCTVASNSGCHREGKNRLLPPVMSGKVKSVPSLRYGVVEVRARIPKGDWLWPAIWMVPRDSLYGGWPKSGEIDIMESRGNSEGLGIGTVSSTLHWGATIQENRHRMTTGVKHSRSWHDKFHIWRMEWTEDEIVTFVDDEEIMRVTPPSGGFWKKGKFSGKNLWAAGSKMAPFDQEFIVIFNVAVGGTNGFFSDYFKWASKKPWGNNSPSAVRDFWNARADWYSSWRGDDVALIIDYVEFRHF